jgi:hypothetical protein
MRPVKGGMIYAYLYEKQPRDQKILESNAVGRMTVVPCPRLCVSFSFRQIKELFSYAATY